MKPAIFLTVSRGIDAFAAAVLDQVDVDFVVMYETAGPLLEARGIPFRKFLDFMPEEYKQWAANEAGVRAGAIAAEFQKRVMQEAWTEYARDDDSWLRLEAEVHQLLRRDLFEEMVYIDAFRRCARELDVRLVLVQQDIARDTKTIIHTAHRLGIPALHILHGFPNGATNLHDECHADVVAVYSEYARRLFESFGMPRDRIHTTGNPEWDKYGHPSTPNFRKTACGILKLELAHPVISYAITYTHRFSRISVENPGYVKRITEVVLRAFAALSRRYPEWQFVLRPHPHDLTPSDVFREQAREAGLERVCIDDQRSSSLLAVTVADVMVCTQSNLGIEMILAGKPVVNVVIDAFAHDVYYEGLGPLFLDEDAVIQVRDAADVEGAIEAAVTDPLTRARLSEARPGTIERFNYRLDGKAGERFGRLVAELLDKGDSYVPPVQRYPEFEQALTRAVPAGAHRVLVAGRGARYVADLLRSVRGDLAIEEAPWPEPSQTKEVDVVILSDPAPHSESVDRLLRGAREALAENGRLIVAFRHGGNLEARDAVSKGKWSPPRKGMDATSNVGEYSRPGMELVLSRCEFEIEALGELTNACLEAEDLASRSEGRLLSVDGWVVCARIRPLHGVGRDSWRCQAQDRAWEAHRHGQTSLREGNLAEALDAFSSAVAEWPKEAQFALSLGDALRQANRPEDAWRQALTALHYSPCLPDARTLLRQLGQELGREAEADEVLTLFGADTA